MVQAISQNSSLKHIGAMDKISKEKMYDPGLYSMQQLLEPQYSAPKKRSTFLGFLGRILLGVVALGVGAIGVRKGLMDYKVIEELPEGASNSAKFKNWFAKNTDELFNRTVEKFFKWTDALRGKSGKSDDLSGIVNNINPN